MVEILERLTGLTFTDYYRSRVLDPSGLCDFHVGMPEEIAEQLGSAAAMARLDPRVPSNLECDWLDRRAGDDINERMRLARRYLDWRRGTRFRREGIPSSWDARLYDKYAVLYRDSLSLKQLLSWYDEQGMDPVGSFPMRLGDMVAAYRAHSGDQVHGIRGLVARALAPIASKPSGPRHWRWSRRVWMQALLLVLGLYDYGGAFRVLAHKRVES